MLHWSTSTRSPLMCSAFDLGFGILMCRQWQLLLSFPNFIATPHIAFLTQEALVNIAETTVDNLKQAALGKKLSNEVEPQD